ncbi:MAG: LLM class flavin-dependent oxidoreductase [Defluviicoccus sp.]|nr:LLM class flavin-dependent oxidoreductase [Defluviicoccus sp.]
MTETRFRALEIGLYSISSTADNRAAARRAEACGFRRLWLAEDHHSRDIFVQATAVATATEAIEIGLGIVNPYTRHPAQIAMAVADLEELAGPRFALGLGAGWSSIAAHGLENPRPIAALKEAAAICRGMLRGDRVAFEGALYRLPAPGARLTFQPVRADVPLYFGTMGPRTLKMAAPLADGVFFSVFTSPAFAEHCLGHVRAALAGTGRTIEDIDIASYIIFSVDEDGDAARDAARRLIAHYLMRIPDTIRFEFAGLDVARMQSLQAGLRAAFAEGRYEGAVDALDDDVVAALAVAGTPEECIDGLKPYAAAGLRTPVLYQVLGPDRMASIDLIADRIRPALAG